MHNTTESKKDQIFIHINRMSFTFFSLISLLLKIICKTLSNSPSEVSGRKYLKLGLSEFLSLLNSLPLRKRCTSITDFRNIGVKCWVLLLITLGVSRYTQPSVWRWTFIYKELLEANQSVSNSSTVTQNFNWMSFLVCILFQSKFQWSHSILVSNLQGRPVSH